MGWSIRYRHPGLLLAMGDVTGAVGLRSRPPISPTRLELGDRLSSHPPLPVVHLLSRLRFLFLFFFFLFYLPFAYCLNYPKSTFPLLNRLTHSPQ